MKISVVIPTYNREEHLNNCLDSLLLQKKKPFEILIVDNSDVQYVKKIINNFENKFKEQDIHIFSIINPINSGAIARNLGASKAKGDLIAFLDDDVLLDKIIMRKLKKYLLSIQMFGCPRI